MAIITKHSLPVVCVWGGGGGGGGGLGEATYESTDAQTKNCNSRTAMERSVGKLLGRIGKLEAGFKQVPFVQVF